MPVKIKEPLGPTPELENGSPWGWDMHGKVPFNKSPSWFQRWSQRLKNNVLSKGTECPPMRSLFLPCQDMEGLPPGSSAASSLRDTRLPQVTDSRADLILQWTLPVLTGAFSPVGVFCEGLVQDLRMCN